MGIGRYVLTGILCGACGWAAHSMLAAESAESLQVDRRVDFIQKELHEILAAIESLQAQQHGATMTATEARESVNRSEIDERTKPVDVSSRELKAELVSLRNELSTFRHLAEIPPPVMKSKDIDAVARGADAYSRWKDSGGSHPLVWTSPHFCWTLQQVLAEFGVPDDVSEDGFRIHWYYYGRESWPGVHFMFNNGVVWFEDQAKK